jgi:hypothetical protein
MLALICLLSSATLALAADQGELRASYVQNLSKFIDWPESAFAADTQHFHVCIQGEEILNTMASKLQGQTIGSRSIIVSPLSRHPKGTGCQALYINASELWRLNNILAEIGNRPVLTISDGSPFAKSGGMIELIPENSRLVFEINQTAIERAGLKISSKVLTLAKSVYR